MRFLSVCSGIEAASVAWNPLGWQAVAFSEVEPFPSAVLATHYPDVPNRGDMTRFQEWPDATIDVLVGGTPCQSFSVAGLRRGLADPRGNLMLTYLAISQRHRPRWLVWENVPGVLSADDGRAFGALLRGLEELGYGWAYRTLDAQFFGLAQRRRRVFVVASAAGWAAAGSVLFEPESLCGHPAPRRGSGQGPAGTVKASIDRRRGAGTDPELLIPEVANPLTARMRKDINTTADEGQTPIVCATGETTHALTSEGFDASEDGSGRGTPICAFSCKDYGADAGDTAPTLRAMGHDGSHANAGGQVAVAFDTTQITSKANYSNPKPGDPCHPLAAGAHPPAVAFNAGETVRRLTVVECERLQGFTDGYTAVEYRGKPAADGPRYKALGNSMAVPVMAWIGKRLAACDAALESAA